MKRSLLLSCSLTSMGLMLAASADAGQFSKIENPDKTAPIAAAAASHGNEISQNAEHFINNLAQEGIGFLGNKEMTQDQRKAAFKKLLNSKFDMQTIGRFALGRYWNTATPKQRTEYLSLFQKMTINSYAERFSDYQGQGLEVRSSRPEGSASDILVNSVIVQDSGPEVAVDWRVRYKNGSYKVVDVIVEGVSMAMTQRSDFSSVIQRGGGNIDVLLTHLRGS